MDEQELKRVIDELSRRVDMMEKDVKKVTQAITNIILGGKKW